MQLVKIYLLTIVLFPLIIRAQVCPVFPMPKTYVELKGNFIFDDMIVVQDKNLPSFAADFLKRYLTHELFVNALFVKEEGQMLFKRLSNVPNHTYSILVDEKITISYSSDESLFYAIQSLRQLIQKGDSLFIRKCSITDHPEFEWRGMHLDVSRHFFSVAEVKIYLDWMARYKFNRFHWHLTDDQAWRVEIKQFPKLTEIGSVRAQTLVGHAGNFPEKFDGIPVKGFYTQEEIKEVVAYAKKRFIEVVPEIEMPGHASAALAAYPEFSCSGKAIKVVEKWGVFDDVFCSKDETIGFLQNILEELIPLFPGDYFHIGGDEVPKTNWKTCKSCQTTMKKNGIQMEEQLQSYFINQMDSFLTKKGKKLIGWDEILADGLSKNAAIMSWRGMKGGIEAAKQNHFVVMTPSSHCYFDHYQSDRKSEPLAIGGYTSLEKVYSFTPIPSELPANLLPFILGGQANLWTEYIDNWSQVEYMIFPRILALSEALWTGGKRDYNQFLLRLEKYEFPYLISQNINYSKAIYYLEGLINSQPDGIEITFEAMTRNAEIEVDFDKNAKITREKSGKIYVFKTNKATMQLITAKSKTALGIDTLGLEILQHRTLGQPWILETPFSEAYAGKGGLTLSDGVLGARPWNGKDWLGFSEKEVKMSFELNEAQWISTFNISFLRAESSWIHLPEMLIIEYSNNGKRWKMKEEPILDERNRFVLNKKAKFIRVTIVSKDKIENGKSGSGHAPWLFLDEIYFD